MKKLRKGQGNDTIYGSKTTTTMVCILSKFRITVRALGIRQEDTLIWFWIGSHEEYNNLIAQL